VAQNQQANVHFHKRIILAVKRVEFVSDRMSHIILKGRWCDIIDLNVHAPTEDKTYDMKDSSTGNSNMNSINSLNTTR
jgi:hypothetical protein